MIGFDRNFFFNETNKPCITCEHALSGARPVHFISHCGGDWIFLCGDESHYQAKENGLTAAHINHLTEIDQTLFRFLSLPANRAVTFDDQTLKWEQVLDVDEEWMPPPNEIVGLDEAEMARFANNSANVCFLKRNDSAYASVSFETGLRAIPIWLTVEHATRLGKERWPNDTVISTALDAFLSKMMVECGEDQWIVIDFLINDHFSVATIGELNSLLRKPKGK